MPRVNFCKHCICEVPLGESCPYCGKKLTKTNERLAFECVSRPVGDWFSWCNYLRILLPVWVLVLLVPLILEVVKRGLNGVAALIQDGFLFLMLGLLGVMLLLILILLILQGEETISYILDKDGIQERSFMLHPKKLNLTARFLSDETLWNLAESEERKPAEGLLLIRRTLLPWEEIRKVNCWKQGGEILVYRPRFWRVVTIHCPEEEYEEAEAYLRAKLKSKPKAIVIPEVQKPKRKK